MTPPRIEFRQLACFVLACQNPTIAQTARQLGISSSTLSMELHSLERSLDLQLFHRKGVYLTPQPAAFWLFREATALLHLESMARTAVMGPSGPSERIHVRLDLSFTMGRFSKAVSRAIELLRQSSPDIVVDFDFLGTGQELPPEQELRSGTTVSAVASEIEIGYFPDPSINTNMPTTQLLNDRWVLVSLADKTYNNVSPGRPLVVLHMRPTLMEAIKVHAERSGIGDCLSYNDAGPLDLADLLTAMPASQFVMPRSMVGERLGLGQRHIEPLEPLLFSSVSSRIRGNRTKGTTLFLNTLQATLKAGEANAVFTPVLTARQIRYFNLIHQIGTISGAARASNVTQPTVSLQIQRMESVLHKRLLERTHAGVVLSDVGQRLKPLALNVEDRLNRILGSLQDVAAHTQSSVVIGMLPSSGHDSIMTAWIAEALIALRQSHPDCRLRVVEGSSSALHDRVRSGELNLAIVSSAYGSLPRIHIGESEPLSVVAHPALGLAGRDTISLAEVCSLPLVLGPRCLSIHRAFVDAAAENGLSVEQTAEVGSLPLAIAMVRCSKLCTVLPASSVQQNVQEGRLTASLIKENLSSGTLAVVFAGERSLSEIERALIQALTAISSVPNSEDCVNGF